jgi:hypothetical protein
MKIEIALSSAMGDLVKIGDKEITIREGKRDYPLGPAVFTIEDGSELSINITSVDHITVNQLTYLDAIADGFENAADLRKGLLHLYPDLTPSSEVTVIYFIYTPSDLTF